MSLFCTVTIQAYKIHFCKRKECKKEANYPLLDVGFSQSTPHIVSRTGRVLAYSYHAARRFGRYMVLFRVVFLYAEMLTALLPLVASYNAIGMEWGGDNSIISHKACEKILTIGFCALRLAQTY